MAPVRQYINLFPDGFGEENEPPSAPVLPPIMVPTHSLPPPVVDDGTAMSLNSFNSYPSQPASTPPTPREGWTAVTSRRPEIKSRANGTVPASSMATGPHYNEEELNSNLAERFSKEALKTYPRPEAAQGGQKRLINQFHSNIAQRYFQDVTVKDKTNTWLDAPEVPTSNELMDKDEAWTRIAEDGSNTVVMPGNRLNGPWPSKDEYLEAHYSMLREEAVQPLRQAISWTKAFPTALEDTAPGGGIGIYTKVRLTTMTFSTRGLGLRVVFSLSRVGKKIRWNQSKRLTAGTLVALTPTKDMFKTKCIAATVAARPLDLLEEDVPKLDLFFANPDDIDLDPNLEYTMIEERTSFFEAVRHLGVSLQKMSGEEFPLKKHIVGVDNRVDPPQYIIDCPKMNLSSVFEPSESMSYDEVDVLTDFPKGAKTSLDRSQQAALWNIFKRRVALIQGPPGTGKTHVSVMALKLLMENMSPEDPPIVVACQTNHALDQLLRHVAEFDEQFIRLGGRSKDDGIVKERTLYKVRMKASERYRAPAGMQSSARNQLKSLEEKMLDVLAPFEYGKDQSATGFMDLETYRKAKILSQKQCDILEKGDQEWTGSSTGNGKAPLAIWLGKYIVHNSRTYTPDNLGGIDFEEADLEYEQIKELEAENVAADDEKDIESLSGNGFPIFVGFSGKPANISEIEIKKHLSKDDLWKIPARFRGAVFNYIQRKAIEARNKLMHSLVAHYNTAVIRHRYGGFENNAILLRQQKVIGVTTTGLSKYRGLIAAVCPRVVMIEEAAETMEAPVTAGCVPTLEHLILVGDHKQLRPQCGVKFLEEKPFWLGVSMFERLVNNGLPFKMLKRQRRMIPEIRRLLGPIYKNDIKDHNSMLESAVRPPVPGMGGINSFFYNHTWPESVDDNYSTTNLREADMVVGFYDYLISNGLTEAQITILCFYNGQRKMILKQLRAHHLLKRMSNTLARSFKVLTVDSYQGEENDVVLLSLAKSNDQGRIGFLGVENRICVALSRAKRGFYMFGNAELLASESKLWAKVINILLADDSVIEPDRNPPCNPLTRVVFNIPLRCTKHDRKIYIEDVDGWDTIDGGCELPCGQKLPCGHHCLLHCHPFEHDKTTCLEPCTKKLPCGHQCSRECYDACRCVPCYSARSTRLAGPDGVVMANDSDTSSRSSNTRAWHDFASGGHVASDRAMVKDQQERYIQGYLSEQTKLTTSPSKTKLTTSPSKTTVASAVPTHISEGVNFSPVPRLMPLAITAPSPSDGPLVSPDLPTPVGTLVDTGFIGQPEAPASASAPTPTSVITVIGSQPVTVRRAKVSHRDRFKRAAPSATPIVTTSPKKAPLVQSPTPLTAVPPPVGYTGSPSLQMPLTPVTARRVSHVQHLQVTPNPQVTTPLSAYSDPFEILESKRSASVGLKEGQPLIEFD